jgi:hypothetical protein
MGVGVCVHAGTWIVDEVDFPDAVGAENRTTAVQVPGDRSARAIVISPHDVAVGVVIALCRAWAVAPSLRSVSVHRPPVTLWPGTKASTCAWPSFVFHVLIVMCTCTVFFFFGLAPPSPGAPSGGALVLGALVVRVVAGAVLVLALLDGLDGGGLDEGTLGELEGAAEVCVEPVRVPGSDACVDVLGCGVAAVDPVEQPANSSAVTPHSDSVAATPGGRVRAGRDKAVGTTAISRLALPPH